jgi:competence protein ComEA
VRRSAISEGKFNRFWTTAAFFLIAVTITGSLITWARCSPGQPIEISLPAEEETEGGIAISGAVTNPGYYPLTGSDSLEALLKAAGGTTEEADLTGLELFVPETAQGPQTQRIDVNRAEVWLLDALPGIGPTRAQAIVDYRQKNGPFRSTNELMKVDGIGTSTYERIRPLITVAD